MADKELVPLPLEDAQMLLNWMEATFGNDGAVDWLDEDAGAVGDALYKAIDNFKAMRAAMPDGVPSGSKDQPNRGK